MVFLMMMMMMMLMMCVRTIYPQPRITTIHLEQKLCLCDVVI